MWLEVFHKSSSLSLTWLQGVISMSLCMAVVKFSVRYMTYPLGRRVITSSSERGGINGSKKMGISLQ